MPSVQRENLKDFIALREEGLNNSQIARQTGFHRLTVYYWFRKLKEAGYKIPPSPQGRSKINLEELDIEKIDLTKLNLMALEPEETSNNHENNK